MILRQISLQISQRGLPTEYTYAFKRTCRFVCNYLEREVLKPLKSPAEGFDKISISLISNPSAATPINIFHVACVQLDFPQAQIDAANGRELTMLQIGFLKAGIEKCDSAHAIPKEELLRGLDRFVEEGMRNEWLHKKKTFKAEGVVASLACKMTHDVFTLRLTVSHLGGTVFDDVILETGSDEILFAPKFKDVVIEGGNLIVREKSDRALWGKPLAELLRKGRATATP